MKSILLTFIQSSTRQTFSISVDEFTHAYGTLRFEYYDNSFNLDCDYLNVIGSYSSVVLEPEIFSSFYQEICLINSQNLVS